MPQAALAWRERESKTVPAAMFGYNPTKAAYKTRVRPLAFDWKFQKMIS